MKSSSTNTTLAGGIWALDPAETSIGFKAKTFLGRKATGQFSRFEATITVAESAADSSVTVVIDTGSVDTGNKDRDTHLRAENVFDVARFPTIEFRSTAIAQTPTGLDITGDLRVRGARP